MNNVIERFLEFKTEEIFPEHWVKTLWVNNGFTSYVPFPSEYDVFLEEVRIGDLINEFYHALKNWFRSSGMSLKEIIINYSNADAGHSQDNDMHWQTLTSEGVDHKALICIIGTLILRFLEEQTNSSYFSDALLSVKLYLYFMAIPGSHVSQIFNSTLYSHVISVIKICCEQIDGHSSGKNKGIKRKKNDNEDDTETDDSESSKLICDKLELISLMNDLLTNLKLIMENKKLKLDDASLNLTVQILMMITRLEKVYATLLVNNINIYRKDSVSYLAFKSFNLLLNMSSLLHSNPSESAKLIIKSMLPIFLINELRTLGLALKDATVVRTNCTLFLKMLLDYLGENTYEAVNILVQRICVAVPDRAEMRMKASNIVLDILKISPPDLLAEEIYSIVFMSHMSETKIRLFTLEIINKLLMETDTNIPFSQLPQKYAAITNEEFLLAVIFYRCQDVVIGIRTKALSYLDQYISCATVNKRIKKIVDKIFVDPYIDVDNPQTVPQYTKEIFDTQQFLLDERFLDDRSLNPLPGVKVVLDLLVYFSQEEKVFIKKCAIQTLGKVFLFSKMWISKELLQVFLIGCDDSSILIRKTMSQILTDLVMVYPDNEEVINCWVEGVVPMIAEEEIKAQEKVVEHFSKIILHNIMIYEHTTSIVSRLPWLVMKEILAQDKRSYLHFAVGKWVQNNIVKNKTVQAIYSHIDTENNIVAWCLLVSFSQFMNLPNSQIIFEYYQRIRNNLEMVQHNQLVLETLFYVCPEMSKEVRRELLTDIEMNLVNCTYPLKLIGRSRDICELIITNSATNKKNAAANVIDWSVPKISVCTDYIENHIGKSSPVEIENVEKLMKYIFLLGELVQSAPNCVSKSNIKTLENILLSPRKRDSESWMGKACNGLKAVTILTLVKLVLQKEETANSIMPIFREILSSNSVDPTIQVNTIIGMCDLCSRYTTLVERYFTYICKCFNSKHENVRMTALISVIKRIKEEYVKLRPFILFPMLTMILDESVAIKRTIASFIGIDLKKKNNILETFFTGIFFFLNNCKDHSTTVKVPDDIRTIFSLTDKPEHREYIYIYILDKLADTSRRLLVCKKIVNEIMGSVADKTLKLNEKTENIVIDAFKVLIDNEKKISEAITKSKKSSAEEGDDIEELGEVNREPKKSHVVVTITEGLRLNEANEIIPIIIKLRLLLKREKSKCMNNLMSYMCELMKNFKNEMTELLNGDVELKTEIEYNLKRMELEEEKKRSETMETVEVNENRSEDENRNLEVLTTSPEEICEQLQNLIVQLSRCDSVENTNDGNERQISVPIVKLTKCDYKRVSENSQEHEQNKQDDTEKDNRDKNSQEEENQVDFTETDEEDKENEKQKSGSSKTSQKRELGTSSKSERKVESIEKGKRLKEKRWGRKKDKQKSSAVDERVKITAFEKEEYNKKSRREVKSKNKIEINREEKQNREMEMQTEVMDTDHEQEEYYEQMDLVNDDNEKSKRKEESQKMEKTKNRKEGPRKEKEKQKSNNQTEPMEIEKSVSTEKINNHKQRKLNKDGEISSENEEIEVMNESNDESDENEYVDNCLEINDEPIEEGEEKFSSDED